MGLLRVLARQFRQPRGLLGKLVGWGFRVNREGNDWVVGLLDIRPTDHVLEVGFGPGYTIQRLASLVSGGRVAGVDFSEVMVRQARKRNAAAVASGRVDLRLGDASALPYPDETFHRALAANVVYFWPDPLANLKELRRVLKTGGRLALYLIAKKDLARLKLEETGIYRLYEGEEIQALLAQAGFTDVRIETRRERYRTGICALAGK
jgi:SAM-dependent methyltransferase